MPDERRSFDRVTGRIMSFCALLTSLATIIGILVAIAWTTYAAPDIDNRITQQVEPLRRETAQRFKEIERCLEYNDAQHRAMMTDAQAEKADAIYQQMRRTRGMP